MEYGFIDADAVPLSFCLDHAGRKVRCIEAPRRSIFKSGKDYTVVSRKEFSDRPASLGVDPDGGGMVSGQPGCSFRRLYDPVLDKGQFAKEQAMTLSQDIELQTEHGDTAKIPAGTVFTFNVPC